MNNGFYYTFLYFFKKDITASFKSGSNGLFVTVNPDITSFRTDGDGPLDDAGSQISIVIGWAQFSSLVIERSELVNHSRSHTSLDVLLRE